MKADHRIANLEARLAALEDAGREKVTGKSTLHDDRAFVLGAERKRHVEAQALEQVARKERMIKDLHASWMEEKQGRERALEENSHLRRELRATARLEEERAAILRALEVARRHAFDMEADRNRLRQMLGEDADKLGKCEDAKTEVEAERNRLRGRLRVARSSAGGR
jgi:hypothetical protein